jgi:hypothetical protein
MDAILQSVRPDARVQVAPGAAPVDESFARAALNLANAFAKGNASALRAMLDDDGQRVLAQLTSSGEWEDAVEKIEVVRIVGLSDLPGDSLPSTAGDVFLAIQEEGGAYLLRFVGRSADGLWKFTPGEASAQVLRRATDWDTTFGAGAAPIAMGDGAPDAASLMASFGANDEMLVMGYAGLDLMRRIENAAGTKPSEQQQAMIRQALGQIPEGGLEVLRTQARAKLEAGYVLPDARIVSLVQMGEMYSQSLGGKVTRDQIIQFVSNILLMPENRVRRALEGGSGGAPPMPMPRGVAPSGG